MTYNGWKNKATWNVSLWLTNDPTLYQSMVDYANRPRTVADQSLMHRRHGPTYSGFVRWAGLCGERTPDGYKFDSKALDYKALTEVIRECVRQ